MITVQELPHQSKVGVRFPQVHLLVWNYKDLIIIDDFQNRFRTLFQVYRHNMVLLTETRITIEQGWNSFVCPFTRKYTTNRKCEI